MFTKLFKLILSIILAIYSIMLLCHTDSSIGLDNEGGYMDSSIGLDNEGGYMYNSIGLDNEGGYMYSSIGLDNEGGYMEFKQMSQYMCCIDPTLLSGCC